MKCDENRNSSISNGKRIITMKEIASFYFVIRLTRRVPHKVYRFKYIYIPIDTMGLIYN
jgi:hypothetical protein